MREPQEALLELEATDSDLYQKNHIFEPEFHQKRYVDACETIRQQSGAFRVDDTKRIAVAPFRGVQPAYADDDTDPSTLRFEGMVSVDGRRILNDSGEENVCILKSAAIREGYIDTGLARSVTRRFYTAKKTKSGVKKDDVLVNSTGDGTIGRVAVYNFDFPALVDGHITVLRYKDTVTAWYVAAFLLSRHGQDQLYRYINGSSGQVELYPQDIGRVWVAPAKKVKMKEIEKSFRNAVEKYDAFFRELRQALDMI